MKLILKARAGLVKKQITNSKGHKTTVWVKPDKKKKSDSGSYQEIYDKHINTLVAEASEGMGWPKAKIRADKAFMHLFHKDAIKVANEKLPLKPVKVDLGEYTMHVSQERGVNLISKKGTQNIPHHLSSYVPNLNSTTTGKLKKEIMAEYNRTKGDIKALQNFMHKRRYGK